MTTTLAPSLGHGPWTQQGTGTTPGYDAIDFRRSVSGYQRGEGVSTLGSFRVVQRGAGANMSVDIGMDDGAWIRGDAVALQGLYYVPPHASTINETIAAADATNPRIDRVVLELKDHQHDASGSNLAQTRVITGTPTGGATLDNLTGAGAVPSSAVLLADVLVAATDTSITDSEIRDRRPISGGMLPQPVGTKVDAALLTSPVLPFARGVTIDTNYDLSQFAALVYMPRRIAAATRLRWRYLQGGTALTGNYIIGLYDSSGRKVIDTGSVAFTGALNTQQVRSETITATTFEPGWYYEFFGVDTTNAGSISTGGYTLGNDLPVVANGTFRNTSGGVTAPQTILGMTDQVGIAPPPSVPGVVPALGISVG